MAQPEVYTYHCICSELVLATFAPLESLPTRNGDGAAICKVTKADLSVPDGVVLTGSMSEKDNPVILRLEDGFEKRYGLQCRRCDLQVGYHLDKSQFEEKEHGMKSDVMYVLPGGWMRTGDMKAGKDLENEIELRAGSAD